MLRAAAVLLLAAVAAAGAWVESVEFPWNAMPSALWESRLVWLKNAGVTHVTLPASGDPAQLAEVVTLVHRLHLEPSPPEPLTRISLSAPDAAARGRTLFTSGRDGIAWTDVFDTLTASGYKPGAYSVGSQERPATQTLRRSALLTRFWSAALAPPKLIPGAATRIPAVGITVRQYGGPTGASFIAVSNSTAKSWTGDAKALYAPLHRAIALPGLRVPARDTVWFPVGLPLVGPLCPECSAFANPDRLIYATAELTAMEYENGILAMEFFAPVPGDAVLQLTSEPTGPFVAGGKPSEFIWDDKEKRALLHIPAGAAPGFRVRIGIAMDAPDSTAFFDTARVMTIGETNRLTAEFSSPAIAGRSRLLTAPEFAFRQEEAKEPLKLTYAIEIPAAAVHGDFAELAIEADGQRLSHARPQLLNPVTLDFPDRVAVRLAAGASLPLEPAVIAVNQRSGRDIAISVHNNAPEIRTFNVELTGGAVEFSPASMMVTVGAMAARDVSFRTFASGAVPGIHNATVKISGAAQLTESLRLVLIPPAGEITWTAAGFTFIESLKRRAAFWPGRWFEFLDKDNNRDLLPAGGQAFTTNPETLKLSDLEALLPRPTAPIAR